MVWFALVGVLWHVSHYSLFNVKSSVYIYIKYICEHILLNVNYFYQTWIILFVVTNLLQLVYSRWHTFSLNLLPTPIARTTPSVSLVLGRTIFYFGMSFNHKRTEKTMTEIFEQAKNEDNIKCTVACGLMVIVVGNGHGDTSSNPGRDWLHFT